MVGARTPSLCRGGVVGLARAFACFGGNNAPDHSRIIKVAPFHGAAEIDARVVGYEALARFLEQPPRTPDVWFREAAEIGRQDRLEVAVVRKALRRFALLPGSAYVSLNASPQTILAGALTETLEHYPGNRLVLEITEHVSVDDYASIVKAVEPLRRRGLRIAVDDAGAGYASFRHILKLRPDLIKLDTSLIRQMTDVELAVLRELGIELAQGYLLGWPAPTEAHLPGQ